ncbi:nucleoside triphosphate pyrophosphatase [Thermohalobacter berrensis]|uniref:dTTP/UTP pyrophosphatase n=1 Tax=Thermohalobacter berrensis TaxID=99594 RepID=A0A419T704_9FIRM|nr:Maf family protein [Thermohalobacter berrensis]RKD33199.1 septum formation protein Maf [Thermohalobacter berrensis]
MKKLILASSSPRRKDILSKYNIDIKIVESNINEKISQNERPKDIAMSLAFQKAYGVALKVDKGEVVLAADTIVVYKGKILGKPQDRGEAIDMLLNLNGKEHYVITGLAIIKAGTKTKVVDYEKTKVKFRNLDRNKIISYVNTGEYSDKAGAYGIQGYGSILVDKIDGSYSNVVGLPISKVDYLLEKFFNIKLL